MGASGYFPFFATYFPCNIHILRIYFSFSLCPSTLESWRTLAKSSCPGSSYIDSAPCKEVPHRAPHPIPLEKHSDRQVGCFVVPLEGNLAGLSQGPNWGHSEIAQDSILVNKAVAKEKLSRKQSRHWNTITSITKMPKYFWNQFVPL